MATSLFANPGQTIKLVIETLNANGSRADGYADGYATPIISTFYLVSGAAASGFPQTMTQLETGVYYHSVTLPSGTNGIGTFIANAAWNQPGTGLSRNELFIINSALPFGNTTVNLG